MLFNALGNRKEIHQNINGNCFLRVDENREIWAFFFYFFQFLCFLNFLELFLSPKQWNKFKISICMSHYQERQCLLIHVLKNTGTEEIGSGTGTLWGHFDKEPSSNKKYHQNDSPKSIWIHLQVFMIPLLLYLPPNGKISTFNWLCQVACNKLYSLTFF